LFLATNASPKPLTIGNPDYEVDSLSILQLHFSCAYPGINDTLITFIPESIGKLTNLRRLNITGNLYLSQLPEAIGQLHNLETLELDGGYLVSLPETIDGLLNLKYLNVQNNRLEHLPNSIGNLTKLECINLIGNNLMTLPESIVNLSGLKYDIDAYANPLKILPKGVSKLPVKILWDGE
jgi:Leucine-rich repeat (LRR) protein